MPVASVALASNRQVEPHWQDAPLSRIPSLACRKKPVAPDRLPLHRLSPEPWLDKMCARRCHHCRTEKKTKSLAVISSDKSMTKFFHAKLFSGQALLLFGVLF